MKSISLTCCMLFLMLNANCQGVDDFKKVSATDIDAKNLEFAQTISDKIFTAQKEEDFYALKETEATDKMIAGLDAKT